jgi:hypothetical protein
LDLGFSPSGWPDFGDLRVGHAGQTGQNGTEVSVGIDVSAAAAFDDRVEDGLMVSGSGFTDLVAPHFCRAIKG